MIHFDGSPSQRPIPADRAILDEYKSTKYTQDQGVIQILKSIGEHPPGSSIPLSLSLRDRENVDQWITPSGKTKKTPPFVKRGRYLRFWKIRKMDHLWITLDHLDHPSPPKPVKRTWQGFP